MYIVTSKMEIKRIKQLAREQGVDLAVQGLVCLPRDIKKYTGSINRQNRAGGRVVYVVIIRYNGFHDRAVFNTEAEAACYLKDVNVKNHLPIRNKFIVFDNHIEVSLTQETILICDNDDIYFVEEFCWHNSEGYVVTRINKRKSYFHNMVMKHTPTNIT